MCPVLFPGIIGLHWPNSVLCICSASWAGTRLFANGFDARTSLRKSSKKQLATYLLSVPSCGLAAPASSAPIPLSQPTYVKNISFNIFYHFLPSTESFIHLPLFGLLPLRHYVFCSFSLGFVFRHSGLDECQRGLRVLMHNNTKSFTLRP